MNKYKRQFVALAAPSGGGKTTLSKMLLKRYSDLGLSISCTTRPPRGREKDGVEYYFLSLDSFKKLIDENAFTEWAQVHGQLYGTRKSSLEAMASNGKVVLLDIDVQGVDSLKKIYGDRCLSIFIEPPSVDELEARLRGRGTESEEKLAQRLENAKAEMARASDFDFRVVNSDLHKAFECLCKILESEVGLVD